jgi:hypothetical protein
VRLQRREGHGAARAAVEGSEHGDGGTIHLRAHGQRASKLSGDELESVCAVRPCLVDANAGDPCEPEIEERAVTRERGDKGLAGEEPFRALADRRRRPGGRLVGPYPVSTLPPPEDDGSRDHPVDALVREVVEPAIDRALELRRIGLLRRAVPVGGMVEDALGGRQSQDPCVAAAPSLDPRSRLLVPALSRSQTPLTEDGCESAVEQESGQRSTIACEISPPASRNRDRVHPEFA